MTRTDSPTQTSQPPSTWLAIAILSFVPLLMVLGNSVLIPVLPTMQEKMHVNRFQVSLLITLFSIPAGLVIPVAGFISDRFSRKWVVIPSLLLFGAGGVIDGSSAWWPAKPYLLVLIGRVIQGIGASGTAPIAMAWMGDLFSGSMRSRALGVNEAGNAFGKVVSPILGAAVALLAWFAVFFIFPVLCVPLAVALWRLLPDSRANSRTQTVGQYLASLQEVARREGRWLVVAYLSGSAALFTLFGVLFYLSDLLETRYGVDGIVKGLVLAIPLLVLSATSFAAGTFMRKQKTRMKWFIVSGFACQATTLLAAVFSGARPMALVALMSVTAIGTGLILPSLNMLITSAVSAQRRGVVTSLYGSVRFLGVAFGPPVFTWLLSISTVCMFLAVAGLACACGLLALWLIRPQTNPQQPTEGTSRRTLSPSWSSGARHKARV
ncbi:MAG: MFS transporter [Alicyclobacillaceae bacterium]|nr:MFS transporter [Alicyclobacillaceae bacterium]